MKHLILSLLLSFLLLVPLSADLVGISGSWYDNFAQTGSWSSLSYAVAEAPNGDLWLATSVTDPNSTAPVARLQRFDGRNWFDEDPGVNGEIEKIVIDSQGHIYIGGAFTEIAGQPYLHLAMFDGTSWHNMDGGLMPREYGSVSVNQLYLDDNEQLWLGGEFVQAGAESTNNMARWNGNAWEGFGTYIHERVAVRHFEQVGDTMYIATARSSSYEKHKGLLRYNMVGSEWINAAVHGLDLGIINGMNFDGNNRLYLGSTQNSAPTNFIFGYYDIAEQELVSIPGIEGINASVLFTGRDDAGNIYLSGHFEGADGNGSASLLKWSNQGWEGFGEGLRGKVNPNFPDRDLTLTLRHLLVRPDGRLYVTGNVGRADGLFVYNIAHWQGDSWQPLGNGLSGPRVAGSSKGFGSSVSLDNEGNLLVGASWIFGGHHYPAVARWMVNEEAWQPLGQGLNTTIHTMAQGPDGTIYAAGNFRNVIRDGENVPFNHIARFNGTEWETMGDGFSDEVKTLYVDDQRIIAGGSFRNGDGVNGAALWSETTQTWDNIGSIRTSVSVIKKGPDGRLYFGGGFTFLEGEEPIRSVTAWDGTRFYPVGDNGVANTVYDLAFLPSGELVAAGTFTNNTENGRLNRIAILKADGQWYPLDQGFNWEVNSLTISKEGAIIAGGRFTHSGNQEMAHLAGWNGQEWLSFHNGPNSLVRSLATDAEGRIWMTGQFSQAGIYRAQGITSWTGNIYMPPVDDVGTALPAVEEAQITIYPNPVSDLLQISNTNEKDMPYQLTNLSVQTVDQGVLRESTLNVSSLPPGIYLLHLRGADQQSIHKIIKQ
ncbi:T9SS type A sorting domain-containing protein [Geofilum rubicundum]|uniref:Secretion system C-terminal sorting domain-containing protein n=1 Tax=Geofilum rubicundum JCM 15548 TaxID=1236989 RepID=A0A0E9M1X7_9BACT|nr:T9SS type A sorting domain-containing protein [Geofilum rubicundum]GAO31509.1 hypothetical protein JCM15548_13876 [Geofilum rubicundum JCM 15548]